MLYKVFVNEWGETTYVPTTLGNMLLTVVIVTLLLIAVLFSRNYTNRLNRPKDASNCRKLTVKQLTCKY